jgi:hypothetical protein
MITARPGEIIIKDGILIYTDELIPFPKPNLFISDDIVHTLM